MLASLTIKNIVLIEQLTINFADGLCALTGETGAGKSILLDSLGLAIGARADAGLVRHGTDQASVTAEFDLKPTHHVFDVLRDNDLTSEEGELVLRRVLTSEGRSKAYVNDQAISANLLKILGENLIEIHGQFDTQNLLNAVTHRGLLDEYAGHDKALIQTRKAWTQWKEAQNKLDAMQSALDKARDDEEYFRKSLEDLDRLSPEIGEEDKLSSLRERLMRRSQIMENLSEAEKGIGEIEQVAGNVWRALDRLGDDGALASKAMQAVNAEIEEVIAALQNLSADIDGQEYSLEEIDDRLFALKAQARKHNCTIDELPAKRDEIGALLNAIENQDHDFAALIRECDALKSTYEKTAQDLSTKRQKASQKMATLVMTELSPLKLDKAQFEVSVEGLEESQWNENGMDAVQFLVATNPGAKAGALNKIASGGELSRFTLALKVILAQTGVAPSLVFDEVDSGIGGATAAAVGERLARLARDKQIMVVTHSPQVAAIASNHWIVSKSGNKKVRTNIIALSKHSDREEEIARMLAGAEITVEARAAARKLLESSVKNKAA
jgi:DNA repair protein RecN (Recombination protein N)